MDDTAVISEPAVARLVSQNIPENNGLFSIPPMYATAVILITLSIFAISGDRFSFEPFARADLIRVEASTKPSNWTGKDEDLALVKGVRLRGADLRALNGEDAFLVRAQLLEYCGRDTLALLELHQALRHLADS